MRALNAKSRLLPAAILPVALLAAVGCLHPTEYVLSDPGGSYTLSTVDGAPVPVLLSTGDSLLSGELGMQNITGVFTQTLNYRRGAGAPFTVGGEGTYQEDGTSLVFRSSSGVAFATGTYDNEKLTFVSSHTYVFLRK